MASAGDRNAFKPISPLNIELNQLKQAFGAEAEEFVKQLVGFHGNPYVPVDSFSSLYQTFMLSIFLELFVLFFSVPVYVYPALANVIFIPAESDRAIV